MEADLDFGCQACKQHQEESKITVSFDRINAFMYYNVDEGEVALQAPLLIPLPCPIMEKRVHLKFGNAAGGKREENYKNQSVGEIMDHKVDQNSGEMLNLTLKMSFDIKYYWGKHSTWEQSDQCWQGVKLLKATLQFKTLLSHQVTPLEGAHLINSSLNL